MATDTFQRKLTAILSADVVGYSRLMGDDEAATVKTLETYKGVMFSLIKQHRGRVVDSPGDNLLAEFGSVVDAVQCAVSIQKELQTRNAGLPENRIMEFRIGINLGDVIEEDDRIYGDGVNIAARLESLADPGGICISKTAFDYIENKLPFGYRFIGEQAVKNIAKPIGAYKVLLETRLIDGEQERKAKVPFWRRRSILSLGITVILAIVAVICWNFYPRGPSIEPVSIEPEKASTIGDVEEAPKSIAVLPFDDFSPEKDQEYFVLGLSEEILNSLTQIPNLTVIAKTSSFSFKGKDKTIQEIANVLDVDHILEGSVRKAGNALRINAQLIKADDESQLWSKTYDRELKDIFEVQENIATAVADELKVTLGIDKSFKQLGGTDNLGAYEYFLVAKGLMSDILGQVQTIEDSAAKTRRAQESLDAAIALDPEFALAWAFIALNHWNRLAFTPSHRFDSEPDPVLNAALKAIEMEPDLAEAYYALGLSRYLRKEFIEAELAYQKAMELSPDPRSCYLFGFPVHSLTVGKLERANNIIEAFRQIDPLNQTNYANSILTSVFLGDEQQAEEKYEQGKAIFGGQLYLGDAYISYLRLGGKDIISQNEIVYSSRIFDAAKAHLDSPKEGLAELHRIYSNDDRLTSVDILNISVWAAYFGDPKLAMKAMEKGVNINGAVLTHSWGPVFREVRQLPRFKEFVREIGLVEYWNRFGWPDNDICRPIGNDDFACD
jgi:adenylate cyclase